MGMSDQSQVYLVCIQVFFLHYFYHLQIHYLSVILSHLFPGTYLDSYCFHYFKGGEREKYDV